MKHIPRTFGLITVLSIALLVAMGGLGVAAASSGDTGEIGVELDPADQTVDPGEEATYDVVVTDATEGIGAYQLTVELGDTSAATIQDYEHEHDPTFDNTEFDGDAVEISAAMGGNVIDGAEEIVLGTVTVAGDDDGETAVAFEGGADEVDVTDEDDNQYETASAADGTLTVDWPEVDVGLSPAAQTVETGEEATYDIVVDGAEEGISAYEMTIELGDTSAATVQDYEHEHDPMFDDTEFDGDAVEVSAAMGDDGIDAGEKTVLGTLTVSGEADGETALAFEGDVEVALDDDAVSAYAVGDVTDATLDVVDDNLATVELVALDHVAVGEVEVGVVVTGADSGIGAYDIAVESSDDAVTFTDYELTAEGDTGPLDNSEISDDGTTLSLEAALLEAVHEGDEEIQIATATVDIEEAGTFGLDFGDAAIQDTDENEYAVATEASTLSASSLPAVAGDAPPQDLTGDGLHEDITGDGDLTIFDVQALFENIDEPGVQDNAAAFNFGGGDDDTVTIFDVQGLFEMVDDGLTA